MKYRNERKVAIYLRDGTKVEPGAVFETDDPICDPRLVPVKAQGTDPETEESE